MVNNKKNHILVVDDELSMRELLELMLTREGYRVSCAESVKDTRFRALKAASGQSK